LTATDEGYSAFLVPGYTCVRENQLKASFVWQPRVWADRPGDLVPFPARVRHLSIFRYLLIAFSPTFPSVQCVQEYFPPGGLKRVTPLKKLHGLSPRANYTDRGTAACQRSDCQLFAVRGCHVDSVTDPYGRILGFLGRSRYFSIK
jgi:hypothetical protein